MPAQHTDKRKVLATLQAKVAMSEQRYVPLGDGVVRFQAGDFVSDIKFDAEGFVVSYPGSGARPQLVGLVSWAESD